ncbi:sugar ABC transporter permease [Tissierella pigra]|uniref:Sugar ABC transporter permease n=1 Tax=Tissierella pigra TaxID=2607614 RepID=A0A6N7XUY6_9FIRM|nr:sugar ABC transporter permease [Tissierella pigra]MBU5427546.1 sugar ABC transporter permease [Tissierella pigra]MSU00295.1 sugar ABC transporter permease [Tissierella pigra]
MEDKKFYGWYFILPSLIGVLIFYIIPFFLSLYYTFTKGISTVQFVGLDNFKELFNNPAFILASKNTLTFIIIGVPIVTMLSLFLSLMMAEKLYRFPRWAMLSPMIVPVASALMGWEVVFGNNGMMNKILVFFSRQPISFFGEDNAMKILILIYIIKNTGYMIVIFTGAISSLEKEYKEAFLLDSNSSIKYAFKIVIPLIAPIIFFVVILSIINSFLMFREVYALYGDIPPNTVYLLQNFMNNNFYKLNYQRLSTAAFILVMGISILIIAFLRFQEKHLDH